uniref:Uncharacterized protein n=1 Tax=Oryza brachyantha TaxID=4533 RepID=J3LC47_ORYBR
MAWQCCHAIVGSVARQCCHATDNGVASRLATVNRGFEHLRLADRSLWLPLQQATHISSKTVKENRHNRLGLRVFGTEVTHLDANNLATNTSTSVAIES